MDVYMIVLRITHIVCIIAWAGWIFSLTLWIQPAVAAAGPAGGAFMGALTSKTSLVKAMTYIASLAILSGLMMMDHVSHHFSAGWVQSGMGMTLIVGGASAIIALSWGMATIRPAAAKMGALAGSIQASGNPPSQDQQAQIASYRETIKKNSIIVFFLILIATVCMSVARYIY